MRLATLTCLTSTLLAWAGLADAQTEAAEAGAGASAGPDAPAADGDAIPIQPEASSENEAAVSEEEPEQPPGDEQASQSSPPNTTEQSAAPPRPPPAPPPAPPISVASSSDSTPMEDSEPVDEPVHLKPPYMGVELFASVLGRVSDSASYQQDRGTDMGYGAGVWYEGGDRLALGASYEYTGLGEGESQTAADFINTEYRVHGLWASGRAYPYRADGVGVFATAGVGMTFMRLTASGTRPEDATQPSEAFLCSAGSTPNLAFAGGAGVNFDVGRQMAFVSQVGAAMYRGTSNFVDGCAPGLGSPVTVGLKLGFAYYFGV